MAVPESATEVFAIDTYEAPPLPTFESSFVTDMALYKHSALSQDWKAVTRLLGATRLVPNATTAETGEGDVTWDFMNGWYSNSGTASTVYSWMWKRAPSFFDAVAYTGTGSAMTVNHNLGVAPEMIWFKSRSNADNWVVYVPSLGNKKLYLNLTNAITNAGGGDFNDTAPTDTVFSVGDGNDTNRSGGTHIAYLFASLDGVSKVGSYTGNGSSQTIDCGFSSGARFVLIKNVDGTGSWCVFDTERGIVSGNDAVLQLQSTTSEYSGADDIDPHSSGFIINHDNTNGQLLNGSGTKYIFYAIA
jgi:hypothetical protein